MKFSTVGLGIFLTLIGASTQAEPVSIGSFGPEGNFQLYRLTDYVWDQIVASYTHLLFSVNFDIHTRDRPGFQKIYRELSDTAWEKSIDLMKYYTVRGGKPDFKVNFLKNFDTLGQYKTDVEELVSLKEAVNLEMELSRRSYRIHSHFSSHKGRESKALDAGIAHFIEEGFIGYQGKTIRKLVGFYNDFNSILKGGKCTLEEGKNDEGKGPLACYMFDQYLQKL